MNLTAKFFAALLFMVNLVSGQEWIPTRLTDFTTIDFPVSSELVELQGETVFSANDDFAIYIVSLRKLIDPQSSQITNKKIPDLLQGVASGAVDAANAKVVSINGITIDGTEALELEYNAPAGSQLPSQRFKRIIYTHQYIISIDFWPLTDQKELSDKIKKQFFNSFSIASAQSDKSELGTIREDDNRLNDMGYVLGRYVGRIAFFLVLAGLIIGIVFLVRSLKRKKKNKGIPKFETVPEAKQVLKITCMECATENDSNSKYCSRCGYELPKINN